MEETVARQLPLPDKSKMRRFPFQTCVRIPGYEGYIQNPHGIRAERVGKVKIPRARGRGTIERTVWGALEPVTVFNGKEILNLPPNTRFTK
ncbi:MAG: hypothetical protein Q7R31_00920 [Candidatus Levybacteria bacterium]|nr:hypothetical protein [Candidatus Levybacteria bacterium]